MLPAGGYRRTFGRAIAREGPSKGITPVVPLAAGSFFLGLRERSFNVNQVSFRQSITLDHLQGRMAASMRFVLWALVPLGSLLGGFGAARIGVTPMLCVAVGGTLLASVWFLLVPAEHKSDVAATARV